MSPTLMTEISKIRSNRINEEHKKFNIAFFEEHHFEAEVKGTLFGEYLKTADVDATVLQSFAFNAYLTRTLIRDFQTLITSLEEFFQLSKIVEQGYYKLDGSNNGDMSKKSLIISKEFGAFYTPIALAREMASKLLAECSSGIIIDPCCGTGNLLAACLEHAAREKIIVKKVVGIEIDGLACSVCREALAKYANHLSMDVKIEIIHQDSLEILAGLDGFFKLPEGSIIINPPYGKLKFNSDSLTNAETSLDFKQFHKDKKKQKYLTDQSKVKKVLNGLSSGSGTLEWSKVFLALCINILPENETLVYIGPCSWLNSVSCKDIREKVLTSKMVSEIHLISESNTGFDTVNQPLSIVCFRHKAENILIQNDFLEKETVFYSDLLMLKSHGFAIPRISPSQLKTFLKLQQYGKIRESEAIKNLRGELDQTINKSIMTTKPSALRLIRGENVGRYKNITLPENRQMFADIKEFTCQLSRKPKGNHYTEKRIVGRQCSYLKQKRRLVFNVYPENIVVGNSCNYLLVPERDLYYHLGLLNSALYDWYFRVMNGNNHVSNYEIGDFPLPVRNRLIQDAIEQEVFMIINKCNTVNVSKNTSYSEDESKLDALVMELFELSHEEVTEILGSNHDEMYISSVLHSITERKNELV
jgi:Alw26I/Eco31I/Esp3I family type II restriction m6 adenine DNA methyltransferase